MNTFCFSRRVFFALTIMMLSIMHLIAQEKSAKFAHIRFPDEIKYVDFNDKNGYVGGVRNIWRFNPKDLSFEQIVDLDGKGLFTQVQGLAAHDNYMYYYINGEGIYRVKDGDIPILVRERDNSFVKNYEEAYSGMNIDPTGNYLLLYGKNENVVVFSINNDMTPFVVFNDYVNDAYWLADCLWAGCLDKVVINHRRGKSMNNEDFIYYDTNDQHGMIKFRVTDSGKLPNFGEEEFPIKGSGEIVGLIYNKENGDVLLCLSSSKESQIFKMTQSEAIPVAKLNIPLFAFAAFGDKIFAKGMGGFVEFTYPTPDVLELKPQPIKTDLIKPKLWPQHKPDPYTIDSAYFLDYDKDGNLWIVDNKDFYIIYKQ